MRLLDAFIASHRDCFRCRRGASSSRRGEKIFEAESKDELDVLSTMNDMRVSDPESSVDKQLEQVQALIERALH